MPTKHTIHEYSNASPMPIAPFETKDNAANKAAANKPAVIL